MKVNGVKIKGSTNVSHSLNDRGNPDQVSAVFGGIIQYNLAVKSRAHFILAKDILDRGGMRHGFHPLHIEGAQLVEILDNDIELSLKLRGFRLAQIQPCQIGNITDIHRLRRLCFVVGHTSSLSRNGDRLYRLIARPNQWQSPIQSHSITRHEDGGRQGLLGLLMVNIVTDMGQV